MFHGQLMTKIILLILMSLVLDKFDNKANKGRKKRKIKKILFHKILYQLLYILKSQPAFQLPCA